MLTLVHAGAIVSIVIQIHAQKERKEVAMADVKALKEKIAKSGIPMTTLSEKTGILRETLYNRLAGKGEFKASEISALGTALNMTVQERDDIFFAS